MHFNDASVSYVGGEGGFLFFTLCFKLVVERA
jgi:hypothetical protein